VGAGTRLAQLAAVHVLRRRWIGRALLVAQVAVVLLIARNWAYVTTYRLFLDRRIAAAASAAAQQFDIEGARVVPLIVTRGADRVAFATEVGQDSTIHAVLRPGPAATTYAIEWQHGPEHRVLAQGPISEPTDIACAYPGGSGVIALVSQGAVTWVDPRVVRDLRFVPHAVTLTVLFLGWIAFTRDRPDGDVTGRTPFAAFRFAAAAIGVLGALLVSEAALRALGDRIPSGIASERHDLGEVTRDPRWIDSPRYGRRLRAGVNVLNEWRHGDIVRMGYIPTPATGGALHRFAFQTDAEGFRNPGVRERFDVAALGDSFTDAMTMAVEASWPARLERNLGRTVQNYGTAGFGPQQELLVLKDFVARHRPRIVVLAFFAGNDIFDAEAFDAFQRSGGTQTRVQQGWRIKDVVSRADTWFVVSALRAGARWAGSQHAPTVAAAEPSASLSSWSPPSRLRAADSSRSYSEATPSFDRGMFDLPVAERRLPFAFMPPYLNTLNFSEPELESRLGWRLTRDAIAEMQEVSRSFGAEFVVLFVPFKSQVYLPLLERTFSADALRSSFSFYLEAYGRDVDVKRLSANRLAQNRMMRRFCEQAGIPFVDSTPALERLVQSGENAYFPDESHLNEAGEAVLADTIAALLKSM
jgi:lysophospholipase L1-like esterase